MRARGRRCGFLSWTMLVAGLAVATAPGCSAGGAADEGGAAEAPFEVEVSQLYITVTNRSGGPLLGVRIEITPAGRATVFTATQGRIESGERRNFALGSFRGRDGTPFNLRVHRPKAVTVTAKSVMGAEFRREVPWP